MNTLDYIREGYRQLSDNTYYTELSEDPTASFSLQINLLIDRMRVKGHINNRVHKSLLVENPKLPNFYMLPKIHNKRPIGLIAPPFKINFLATEN